MVHPLMLKDGVSSETSGLNPFCKLRLYIVLFADNWSCNSGTAACVSVGGSHGVVCYSNGSLACASCQYGSKCHHVVHIQVCK